MARVPTLTGLDRSVLAALPGSALDGASTPEEVLGVRMGLVSEPAGVRAAAVARHLRLPAGEVREVLRGLEAVGLAQQASGWWRRA